MNRSSIDALLLVLLLLVSACAHDAKFTASDTPQLSFIHLNDTYRIDAVESGSRGGFGRVVTLIRELQREGRDLRILHGGDFLYPSLESQLWDGQQMIEALNYVDELAGLVAVIGNHELDKSNAGALAAAVRASRFDWLGDNYALHTAEQDVDDALRTLFSYTHAGRKVGVFALTLNPVEVGNARPYIAVDTDYLAVAKRSIARLEEQGVDLIIGLTHLHFADDLQIAALRREHPKFAFIAGGHEHEPMYSPISDTSAAVLKGASNARVIWRVDVSFDADGLPLLDARRQELDESVAEDPDYALLAGKWRARLLERYPLIDAKIGRAGLPMDATEETIRNEETSWGNFIVDQMRRAFGEPQADLAFLNSGTVRIDDFVLGDIRYEEIARTFGYSSYLRYLPIPGSEFRALMEAGYRGTGTSKGYFPLISGFRVCVDRGRPDGERIVSLQVPAASGWQEMDPVQEYTLVMSDFLFEGNDGYELSAARKATASRPGSELKYLVLDAIVRAQAEGRAVGVAVDSTNPRFVALGPGREQCWQ